MRGVQEGEKRVGRYKYGERKEWGDRQAWERKAWGEKGEETRVGRDKIGQTRGG